jgi:hypothetical protein
VLLVVAVPVVGMTVSAMLIVFVRMIVIRAHSNVPAHFVIPAKAGIQWFVIYSWIPVFTGMTKKFSAALTEVQ